MPRQALVYITICSLVEQNCCDWKVQCCSKLHKGEATDTTQPVVMALHAVHTFLCVQGLAKAWTAWQVAAEERARERALMLQALGHLRLLQARKAWHSWLLYMQRQLQKHVVRGWH
jgi:hypothetical protein